MLDGAELRHLKMNHDERGCFTEVFYTSWGLCVQPKQWSIVHSKAGTFRGMHLHLRHTEYVAPIAGMMFVGMKDIRPGSPTEGVSLLVALSGEDMACLSFPEGIVHGWLSTEDSIHLQAVSEDYFTYGEFDNHGCHYADPGLGIAWPIAPTLISPRAAQFGPLSHLEALMKDEWPRGSRLPMEPA